MVRLAVDVLSQAPEAPLKFFFLLRLCQHGQHFRKLEKAAFQRKGRAGRKGDQAGIETDGQGHQPHTQNEDQDFRQKSRDSVGRHQGEEDENHGIGKIAFGIKLGALRKDQNKGNQQIKQDAEGKGLGT